MKGRVPLLAPGAIYYGLVVALLYLPLLLLVIFSFNDAPLLAFPLKGFTLKWYGQLWQAAELLEALGNSLLVAAVASLVATALGTMVAIAVSQFSFPGRSWFLLASTLPLVIPSIVIGVALLIGFSSIGVRPSLLVVGVGHIIVTMPYAVLIVSARPADGEANLIEAAMDLGASYWMALARITLPLARPALLAAFLTSFTISLDEFELSFFLTGTDTTLPIYLYSQLRFPQRLPLVVSLATILIVCSVLLVIISERIRQGGQQLQPLPARTDHEAATTATLGDQHSEPKLQEVNS